MNSIDSVLKEIADIQESSYIIDRIEMLEHESYFFKARIYFRDELYIQAYRNNKYRTTNFVLIFHDERIYGRDEIREKWHKHPANEPDVQFMILLPMVEKLLNLKSFLKRQNQ